MRLARPRPRSVRLYSIREGHIVQVREYLDSLHAAETLYGRAQGTVPACCGENCHPAFSA